MPLSFKSDNAVPLYSRSVSVSLFSVHTFHRKLKRVLTPNHSQSQKKTVTLSAINLSAKKLYCIWDGVSRRLRFVINKINRFFCCILDIPFRFRKNASKFITLCYYNFLETGFLYLFYKNNKKICIGSYSMVLQKNQKVFI